jgi:hypothetical protein
MRDVTKERSTRHSVFRSLDYGFSQAVAANGRRTLYVSGQTGCEQAARLIRLPLFKSARVFTSSHSERLGHDARAALGDEADMKLLITWFAVSVVAGLLATVSGADVDAQVARIAGVTCSSPAPLHCPAANCPRELVAHSGNAVLPKSNRTFFLDYPCDLKPAEPVTFVLNLHGGGSIGNWQRHYFPIMDSKDKYRLVVATPSAVKGLWSPEDDDAHLRMIVNFVFEQFGAKKITAFWLAGHSHGGLTANRLLRSEFYRSKLTGFLSLSGGRLGSPRAYAPRDLHSLYLLPVPPGSSSAPAGAGAVRATEPGVGLGDASNLPDYNFSHIYTSGEYELTAAGLPDHSLWAQRLGCKAQTRRPDVVDVKAGYVWDARLGTAKRSRMQGLEPRPGRARVFVYPECSEGHVVADVIRLDKGHTEGFEPHVTEEIVRLMLSAKSK